LKKRTSQVGDTLMRYGSSTLAGTDVFTQFGDLCQREEILSKMGKFVDAIETLRMRRLARKSTRFWL
jgi:hypothetical protein